MTIRDLIEDWIAMRSTLSRQLAALKSGQMHSGTNITDSTLAATIARLEKWISELNALLKEYAIADRT